MDAFYDDRRNDLICRF